MANLVDAIGLVGLAAFYRLAVFHRPTPFPIARLAGAAALAIIVMHGTRWNVEAIVHRVAAYLHRSVPICTATAAAREGSARETGDPGYRRELGL